MVALGRMKELVCQRALPGFCLPNMTDRRKGKIMLWLGVQVWQKVRP